MNKSIFAFVFPFDHGAEFRCKRDFLDIHDAANWAMSMLKGGEFCLFREVPSSGYVFDPVEEAHWSVSCHPYTHKCEMMEITD